MTAGPVIQFITQRTDGDCAIVALAMYLQFTYEDVLVAAAQFDLSVHRHGMWIKQIEAAAQMLGTPLRRRRKWDTEVDHGILSLTSQTFHDGHVVVLTEGLIFDTAGCVWDPHTYLEFNKYQAKLLLTRREEP